AALERVVAGAAAIETRTMLHMRIVRDGAVRHETPVLNDVVVNRGPLSRMTDLSVHVDDLFVARFKADGLIVATATGSTAYNLSAGGPIVHPHVDAIVLTPIAPHTLTNRPVVLPATAALTIQPIIAGGEDIFVTADGQTGYPLSAADAVTVTRADRVLRLVRSTERSYFGVLRQKLKWAER
ncbi:MAG: NAD(+)/NADH kinase, partial [Vicinamibacteria bacterium]